MLKKQGLSTGLGDEGGFAPNLPANVAALELISTAIESTGLKLGTDIALALDVASTEFFTESTGLYSWEGGTKSADEMTAIYEQWITDFPIVSIEDPLAEDDWAGWSALMGKIGDKVQVVGDDLFVTNVTRLQRGIDEKAASALLVKVNQIGSLTETLDAVDLAHRAGFRCMMSHRSGETEDTTIADLAVATNCGQIKSGAPGAYGPGGQVQPAVADRGGPGRRGAVRRGIGLPEVQGLNGVPSGPRGTSRPGPGPGRGKPRARGPVRKAPAASGASADPLLPGRPARGTARRRRGFGVDSRA